MSYTDDINWEEVADKRFAKSEDGFYYIYPSLDMASLFEVALGDEYMPSNFVELLEGGFMDFQGAFQCNACDAYTSEPLCEEKFLCKYCSEDYGQSDYDEHNTLNSIQQGLVGPFAI